MDLFDEKPEPQEVDPASEFLAREQSALAGLEDEVQPAATLVQSNTADVNEISDHCGSFEIINSVGEQQENQENSTPAPPQQPVVEKVEPEKIRKWREEQATRLLEKDREEEKKKEELRLQAKQELEDWYKHHEEAIAKTKAANRNAEKQFVAENDELEPGTEWERIAKLCDFNPKGNKSSKDVSRMRSIVLQLKQNPIKITRRG